MSDFAMIVPVVGLALAALQSCGTFVSVFATNVPRVARTHEIGVDISGEALQLAKERATSADVKIDWVQADVCALPHDDQSFDLVVDRGCLHHFTHSEWGTYACEVARVLAPGGISFIRGMSDEHRHKNILRSDYVREHFDNDDLHIIRTVPYRMIGPTKDAAALMAVIERR